jgi:hypothetical protein
VVDIDNELPVVYTPGGMVVPPISAGRVPIGVYCDKQVETAWMIFLS